MTKGLPRSLKHAASRDGEIAIHKVVHDNLAITNIDGATGIGWGSVVIGGLPQGNILFLGAVCYAQFTKTSSGITTTFTGNYGVGTTPADDATITAGDVNLIASSAISAATASLSPVTRGTGATVAIHDNTDGSLELNLNLLIADAAINADDQTATVDLILEIAYARLLDD